MAKKYYKTDNPVVLAALAKLNADTERLKKDIDTFSARFGVIGLTRTTVHGVDFGGLVFSFDDYLALEDKDLWTKPDSNRTCYPRRSIKGKANKERLEALRKRYFERDGLLLEVRFDDFFKSMNTDWGNLMFSGLNWFEHNGQFYCMTGQDFSDRMTEILGSEYEVAERASK